MSFRYHFETNEREKTKLRAAISAIRSVKVAEFLSHLNPTFKWKDELEKAFGNYPWDATLVEWLQTNRDHSPNECQFVIKYALTNIGADTFHRGSALGATLTESMHLIAKSRFMIKNLENFKVTIEKKNWKK